MVKTGIRLKIRLKDSRNMQRVTSHKLSCDQLLYVHLTENWLDKNQKTKFLQKTRTPDWKKKNKSALALNK